MSAPEVRVWQGIEAEYPPEMRNDTPELLAMAEALLESRRKRFPGMIQRGDLAADAAARQIALFEQIAADLRWWMTGEGEPSPADTLHLRAEALDESLRTVAALAGKQGGFDDKLAHQAGCLIALRWLHEPHVHQATLATARLTHELRARARAVTKETSDA